MGRERPAASLGSGVRHRAHHRYRHRRVRRLGEHRGVAPAVERRVLRDAEHVRPAGDHRRRRGRPHRRDGRCAGHPARSWHRGHRRGAIHRRHPGRRQHRRPVDPRARSPGRDGPQQRRPARQHPIRRRGSRAAAVRVRCGPTRGAGRAQLRRLLQPPARTHAPGRGQPRGHERRPRVQPRVLLRDDRRGWLLRRIQLRGLVHLARNGPATGRATGSGQRPGSEARARGRPQGRRPRPQDRVRRVRHRTRCDGDASQGRPGVSNALRRHQR